MTEPLALVTGTSGVVGTAIAHELHAHGWRVRGWDLRPGRWTNVQADLRDPEARARALHGAECVVHTAALHAPHVGVVADEEFESVNVAATESLVRAAEQAGVRRLVYTSSTSVYGDALVPSDAAVWVTESVAPRPRDVYDRTTVDAEAIVADSTVPSLSLRIARCFAEPRAVQAAHRLYRGVDLADVGAAHRLAAQRPDVDGVLTIAGPYRFVPEDAAGLWSDAPEVIRSRAPDLVTLFASQGWALPLRIDRVYDSALARARLGYAPAHGPEALEVTPVP